MMCGGLLDMLKVNNVSKVYNKKVVLSDFSIHVPKGKLVALVGQNGAGKTTLLHIICGLIKSNGTNYTLQNGGE